MVKLFKHIIQNFLAIGIKETDSEALKIKKASINIVPLIMAPT